jgi:hypothetical protein
MSRPFSADRVANGDMVYVWLPEYSGRRVGTYLRQVVKGRHKGQVLVRLFTVLPGPNARRKGERWVSVGGVKRAGVNRRFRVPAASVRIV